MQAYFLLKKVTHADSFGGLRGTVRSKLEQEYFGDSNIFAYDTPTNILTGRKKSKLLSIFEISVKRYSFCSIYYSNSRR